MPEVHPLTAEDIQTAIELILEAVPELNEEYDALPTNRLLVEIAAFAFELGREYQKLGYYVMPGNESP